MNDQIESDSARLVFWNRLCKFLNFVFLLSLIATVSTAVLELGGTVLLAILSIVSYVSLRWLRGRKQRAGEAILDAANNRLVDEQKRIDKGLIDESDEVVGRLQTLEQLYQSLLSRTTAEAISKVAKDNLERVQELRSKVEQRNHESEQHERSEDNRQTATQQDCAQRLEDASEALETADRELVQSKYWVAIAEFERATCLIGEVQTELDWLEDDAGLATALRDQIEALSDQPNVHLGSQTTLTTNPDVSNGTINDVRTGQERLDRVRLVLREVADSILTQRLRMGQRAAIELAPRIRRERERQSIEKHIEEAERKTDNALCRLNEDATPTDLESARDGLNSAASTIDSLSESVNIQEVDGSRIEKIEARIAEGEQSLGRHQRTLELESEIEKIEEQIELGVNASAKGAYQSATGHFGYAQRRLDTATNLVDGINDTEVEERVQHLKTRLEEVRSDSLRHKHHDKCQDQMEVAEKLVSEGIDAAEDSAHREAKEAFSDAIRHLSRAEEVAQKSDLPEQWELEMRLTTVREYHADTKASLDADLERRVSEAARHIDRAEQLLSKGQQQLDIEDASAANESWMTARDALDTVDNLLKGIPQEYIDDQHSRLRETENSLAKLRNAIGRSGYDVSAASRSKLVDALQELAVTIGESPRKSFVDTCGRYATDEYIEMFGSWEEALQAANLDPIDWSSRNRRKYTRVDILESIARVTEQLGRQPTKVEMNERGEMSVTTVENRFSSWETALDLAARVDVDSEQSREDAVAELTTISGVTESEASALYDVGFTTVTDLQRATVADLTAVDAVSEQIALRIKADIGDLTATADQS